MRKRATEKASAFRNFVRKCACPIAASRRTEGISGQQLRRAIAARRATLVVDACPKRGLVRSRLRAGQRAFPDNNCGAQLRRAGRLWSLKLVRKRGLVRSRLRAGQRALPDNNCGAELRRAGRLWSLKLVRKEGLSDRGFAPDRGHFRTTIAARSPSQRVRFFNACTAMSWWAPTRSFAL